MGKPHLELVEFPTKLGTLTPNEQSLERMLSETSKEGKVSDRNF